jgi:hypothetical protein
MEDGIALTFEPPAKLLKAREGRHSGQAKRDPESCIFEPFIPAFAGMTEQAAFARGSMIIPFLCP